MNKGNPEFKDWEYMSEEQLQRMAEQLKDFATWPVCPECSGLGIKDHYKLNTCINCDGKGRLPPNGLVRAVKQMEVLREKKTKKG